MKIAIHHRENSFSERWISYCEANNIEYIIVNAFDNNIIQQLKGCDILMWHHHHGHFKDVLTAKRILFSLEQSGMKVFPDRNTGWHFDDKVAQKYLLESIEAPIVPSHVFYDKKDAMNWAKKVSYPKVFKLKGGAGSSNVKLVKNENEALKIITKAFGRGFKQFDSLESLYERINKYKRQQASLGDVLKGVARLFISPNFSKLQGYEKGYVYFQDFIPNNSFDIRVIVIGDKAFAIKRTVRPNDFRASGSGIIDYDKSGIDLRCLKISFDINSKIGAQCLAYDFIFDLDNNPLIVEISYGFNIDGYKDCPGFWDRDLNWNQCKFDPYGWMIEQLTINN